MIWSQARPMQPGWYWFRGEKQYWAALDSNDPSRPGVVELSDVLGRLELNGGQEWGFVPVEVVRGEWAGPLSSDGRWTIAKPVIPGWYWYRLDCHREAIILESDGAYVYFPSESREAVELVAGEWAGPIPEPLEIAPSH